MKHLLAEKRFSHLRTVIGARLHENHYSEPVLDNTNLSNVCVLILQWLAAESSDCSSEGSEGSHHHSWPRGPRCDLSPNPTLGVFLRGRRDSPSFHLENKTKTVLHQEPQPRVFSTRNYTPVTTLRFFRLAALWGHWHVAGRNQAPDLILNMSLECVFFAMFCLYYVRRKYIQTLVDSHRTQVQR